MIISRGCSRLGVSAFCLLGLALASAAEVETPIKMETFVYKRVGPLEIKADVYQKPASVRGRPVVVYIHGGSLIGGGRDKARKFALKDGLLARGVLVVSIDYRLAPETKLADMVSDVEDAFAWVRRDGPALFGADPGRVAAAGGSAGGYLTLLAGHWVKPLLRALLVEYGYGDIVGTWMTEPSRHAPHWESKLTREEAWRLVSGPPVANGDDRPSQIGGFNGYVRQRGEWPKAISGWDPIKEADKFVPYLPVRNVSPEYPPTFLIHGREDTDIPFSIAQQMAAELKRHGVEHKLIGIAGGEHGYEGADPGIVAAAHREAAAFMNRHLLAR